MELGAALIANRIDLMSATFTSINWCRDNGWHRFSPWLATTPVFCDANVSVYPVDATRERYCASYHAFVMRSNDGPKVDTITYLAAGNVE